MRKKSKLTKKVLKKIKNIKIKISNLEKEKWNKALKKTYRKSIFENRLKNTLKNFISSTIKTELPISMK